VVFIINFSFPRFVLIVPHFYLHKPHFFTSYQREIFLSSGALQSLLMSFGHDEINFLDLHQCTQLPSGRLSFFWSAPIKIYTNLYVQPQVTKQVRTHEVQDESVLI